MVHKSESLFCGLSGCISSLRDGPFPQNSRQLCKYAAPRCLRGLALLRVGVAEDTDLAALAPVDNQGLPDEEKHDGDLRDREEAPNRRLLHKVGAEHTCHDGAEKEQEDALEDHAFLLVESKEGCKHQKRVDRCTHDIVGRISHGHRPAKMPHGLSLECAELLTAKPLGGLVIRHVHGVHGRNVRQEVPDEQQETSNKTKPLDHPVLHLVVLRLGQTAVDHVAVIGLQADVQKAQKGQNLIDDILAVWIIQACRQKHVLNRLQELHTKEEEHTRGQLRVVRSTHDKDREQEHSRREEGQVRVQEKLVTRSAETSGLPLSLYPQQTWA